MIPNKNKLQSKEFGPNLKENEIERVKLKNIYNFIDY